MNINKNDRLLFIGDSVTDGDRNKEDGKDMGKAYPLLITAHLKRLYPEKRLTCLNRGVSGDRLIDLKDRWEEDCLAINPDIVTVLIGINDTLQNQNKQKPMLQKELDAFESNYRFLLKSLHQQTDARVILMEPFVLPYPKDRVHWRQDLDPRIQVIRKMAREYQTELVPLDGLLNACGIRNGFSYYTGEDGIHPTLAGHAVIAQAWLDTVIKGKA
ncbi:lipase/acylhydrolase family protein [Alkalibacterium sp. AK22]|uniref:SGNH/GDSL hydrolase family protein n=1 Tax=Alkalibacterium sp. AK22 TaxID=1229520 RepID=UPI000446F0D9|nr:SGNH/GDSL hydrolase family protein [Alkalibacterium sp. AK22]EXJ23530.1 lipase/acylhydrolase family protein [Alkalibacterium sp. AK22]